MLMTQITPITPIEPLNRQITNVQQQNENSSPFRDMLNTMVQNLIETETTANNNSLRVALGDIDDLHTIGIDATRAFLAQRLVIEVRNRALEAHSEIMRLTV